MCGIAGIIKFDGSPPLESELKAMISRMEHRGPDGSGIKIFGGTGLAHRRLSIIDIEGGVQPMSNEDGLIWTSFNGEIYNFAELAAELRGKGHRFATRSDTETLVHLYEEHGSAMLSRLNGMFAFAILDLKKRKLLLARDRLGQKPLVYFKTSQAFAFASELQALTALPNSPKEISRQSLHDYFSLQYVPAPASIYKNIFKLMPGHFIELDIDSGNFRENRYWECRFDEKIEISYADAKEKLRELVFDSVKLRMISDVPIGAFLSGGLDSSIVSGVMSKISKDTVNTYTIGFAEDKYDESAFARKVAGHFGTRHHERKVRPDDFQALERLVRNSGEPFSDSSILPTFLLSRFTREKATVALSGDGADELFAGYYRYFLMKILAGSSILSSQVAKSAARSLGHFFSGAEGERSVLAKVKRILDAISVEADSRYFKIICRFDEAKKMSLYGPLMREIPLSDSASCIRKLIASAGAAHPAEKISEADIASYLPNDILHKIDAASMSSSLELRSPFLDYRIAEFASSLPFCYKLDGMKRKKILADAFSDILPAETIRRSKLGFGVPVCDWLRGSWAEIARERLAEGRAVKEGFLEKRKVMEILKEHQCSKSDHSYVLWSLLVFEIWLGTRTA